MRATQPSFTGGELKPSLHGRTDIAKYGVSCKVLRNMIIHSSGGISNRGGMRYLVKAKYDDKNTLLVPFQFSTEQNYMLEFGHEYMRVYKDGGLVLNASQNLTSITKAVQAIFSCTAHGLTAGTWVFIANVSGMKQVNGRFFIVDTVPTPDTFTVTDLFGTVLNSSFFDAYTFGGTVSSVYEIATPYDHLDLCSEYEVLGVAQEKIGIDFTQSADVMTISHVNYDTQELSRTGHTSWAFTTVSYSPNISAPTGVSISGPAASGGSSTIRYVVTAVDEETGEESVASAPASTAAGKMAWTTSDYIDISWSGSATKYNVYKDMNGFYGFIGPASGTSFRDDNIEPVANDSPPQARNPFSGAGNKAGAITLHDQRRVFARTLNKPDTVFMSQTANYRNMNVSQPAKDSDALTFTIASQQVNAIKYLLSIGDLLAFTGNAEWLLAGQGDTPLSPSTISASKQTSYGIAPVPPLLSGNSALMVQAFGQKIYDLRYSLEADGYNGNEISILSSHLFRKTRNVDKRIIDWCYQKEPDSLVWIACKDGSFASLTYQREHEVWGFARHDTDGEILRFSCIPEGDSNYVYAVVRRTIGGVSRQVIERMETRKVDEDDVVYGFFVDSGITIDGNSSYDIYGLEHLNGATVTILADGSVLPSRIISGGKITLDKVYNTIHIGRSYISDVQPLDIETELRGLGSTKGKAKRIPRVFVHVYSSRGLKAGPDENNLREYKAERTTELLGEPTRLQSRIFEIGIKSEWKTQASVFLRHDVPLPITILSITPDVEFAT